ncbi:hypothetical protein [Streptomyces sp. N50]|nr:hypothetical protein [Streptomyces sp. N50]WOX09584.1 hypothetical protein R2B38_12180 [Streptomyces sp. N50]
MATEPEGRRSTWHERVATATPWISLAVVIYKIIEELLRHM